MDNKTLLEGILWDLKCLADLLLHGTIESKTKKVHQTFLDALNETLTLQNDLYTLMSDENMVQVENVAETKITKVAGKFNPALKEE